MNEILDQLRTTFASDLTGRGITTFFKGVQAIPAKSDMPMLMVYGTGERTQRSGTVRDSAEYDITVEIIADVKQYFDNSAGQGTQLDAYNALIDIMGERETDGDLKTNTVMGILNANLTIGSRVLYINNLEVSYDPYYDEGDFPVVKAVLSCTAFDRPNRT